MDKGSGLEWVTLFSNKMDADGEKPKKAPAKKAAPKGQPTLASFVTDIGDQLAHDAQDTQNKPKKAVDKRLSVERIYQKKTQLEHILLRPDTYIGSVESVTQPMWVYDEETDSMVNREITYVPGLYKIFDEILVNAADNKQRDQKMSCIKVDIDTEQNKLKIWNNGKGIPVIEHKDENMFVPTMIFGHLLTSSNYDDTEMKVTGGRNGYGAKLCNIFSEKFIVETSSNEYKKAFKQTWIENMSKTKDPHISPSKGDDFTSITFHPDLSKFKMEKLDRDIVALFTRRAYDIAASSKGVKVFLNGKKLPVKNFREYVEMFIKDKVDDHGQPLKVVYEQVNDRWEVALTLSEKGFQQASFVNSIATTKGGRHVDYVTDQVVAKLMEIIKKRKKGSMAIKPFQIKNHVWVFVNCLIVNPTFDSQTKENMTLQSKNFGSKCQLTEKFVAQASKCGIVEGILAWMSFKEQSQLNKKCHASKHSKLKGVPKLDDANDAGTKNSQSCTLILTEGDSAKTLAVSGLSVIGRDRYGVFPLRGKMLNVREASHKQIMENAELNSVVKIMGLQFKEKYDTEDKLKTLRYGKVMIMTDQDQDGSHIKGLFVNFIHHFWPNLLKYNVVEQFITPIVKVSKGKEEISFYSLPEFKEWKDSKENWNTWKVKYYKGLGTSTSKEAKEYFADMARHRILFKYEGAEDDASIVLAFSKKKVDDRKQWLTNFMDERKRRNELGLPEVYLYAKDTKRVTFNDFVNRELILFSDTDNNRSIPSMVDGLKPGQRKVMFACFKRNDKREVKVAQLAGSVAEHSCYHHGEASLMGTIINLAQNFVGSNNINTLLPIGQFGTRIHGGKDAASPRYIFTMLSPLARIIFDPRDMPILTNLYDDNQKIEPEYYVPIIPMALVNGCEGIGTGWSCKVLNFDSREIVANIKRMIDNEEPLPMTPKYKNFVGTVEDFGDNRYLFNGEVSIIDDTTIEISELPIRTWTQNYKEDVLEAMLNGTEKVPPMITDYKEYHTDVSVKFVITMASEKLAQAEEQGLHKVFKLQYSTTTNSMVLFDKNGCIRRYENVLQIIREFFDIRLEYYRLRKIYMEGILTAESLKLDNVARFILEKIDGTIVIENVKKKDMIQVLVRRGFDSDPVKAWKDAQNKDESRDEENLDESNENSEVSTGGGPDYNYLLGLPLWSLTKEKKDELIKQKEAKAKELADIRRKTPPNMWKEDLETLLVELDKIEAQEVEDAKLEPSKMKKPAGKARKAAVVKNECLPSPAGRRVIPRIDPAMRAKAAKDPSKKRGKKLKMDVDGDDGDDDTEDKKQPKISKLFSKDGETKVKRVPDDDDDDEPKSLADRLDATKKMPVKRAKKLSGSPAKSRDKKKKNPWETDSEESGDSDDESFHESAAQAARHLAPRRAAAAKPAKYNYDDDEEDDKGTEDMSFHVIDHGQGTGAEKVVSSDESGGDDDDGSDDDDFGSSKPPEKKVDKIIISSQGSSKTSKFASQAATVSDSDSDSEYEPKSLAERLGSKKAPSDDPEPPIFLESDNENDDIFNPKPVAKTNDKKKAKKKKVPTATLR